MGFRSKLHRNYVGAIERGEINPTLRVILKLCKGLQMWPSELAELTELRWEELRGGGARSSVEPRRAARSQHR
ncbi:MAG TPA: helix-turn-helix transcriptional regulator [Conexibacter sp.]|nr:helix-turn-helix transcriptional regulator [Conexibacter sp.]